MTVAEAYSVEIIKLILSMTITGSILSVFLFIAKPFIKDKLPKSFQYYMWFSVVIALMLPGSKIIVIPVSSPLVISMESMPDIAQWISDTVSERLVFAPQNGNEKNILQMNHFPDTVVILSVFWQAGMILILGFNIICYSVYVRSLNKHNISADQQEIELLNNLSERKSALRLYKNSMVQTPILIGFFHPVILLPDKEYEEMKLRNILMHEITHMNEF